MDLPASYTLRARYVFPVDGPPIRDGLVQVSQERIRGVGPAPSSTGERSRSGSAGSKKVGSEKVLDLGNVAILPGLVNAHVHLEFSDLAVPFGEPGTPLPDWIRQVLRYRQTTPTECLGERVASGLRESHATGTTTLGEIATQDWEGALGASQGLQHCGVTALFELIGRSNDRVESALTAARKHLAAANSVWRAGLSPHAPYTISAQLLDAAVQLAVEHRVPLAMHLAESLEEIEWLTEGTGKFAELLAEHGGAMAERSDFRSAVEVLEHLRPAPHVLLIHGNYLDAAASSLIAADRDRFSVVYCPRTHAFFRHTPYPLAELLEQGINVALGTDGRGSNPDLSILAEMRFVARHHPAVAPAEVLRLGTLSGAKALGLSEEIGSIAPGKFANLTIVPLPDDRDPVDPHEGLFTGNASPWATIYRGHMPTVL